MAVLIHERPEGELVVRCLQPLLCHRRSLDVPVPRRETPYPLTRREELQKLGGSPIP